jgi:tetratricopeptide (TPR) repeat protein
MRYWTELRADDAGRYWHRAIELDSGFALAWVALAEYHMESTRNRPEANAALDRAVSLSDRLTERERLRLDATIAAANGQVDQVVKATGRLAERFPDRDTWYNHGTALMRARRCREAIVALSRSLEHSTRFANAHINIATCHQFLGYYPEAVRAYTRAHAADSTALYRRALNHELGIALVRAGLADSARRVFERMSRVRDPADRQFGFRSLGYLAAYEGRYRAAAAYFDTSAAQSLAANVPVSAFRSLRLRAEHLLAAGDAQGARRTLDDASSVVRGQYLSPYFAMAAGLTYARARQLGRAAAMLDTIDRYALPGAAEEQSDRAIVAAAIALARGDARRARVDLLRATDTTRYDFTLSLLADVYETLGHRDSAYRAATQLSERAPFGTDAQEGWFRALLGRARQAEELGRHGEARQAFGRLDSLWSQGESDLPALREARRGVGRTRSVDASASRSVPRQR